MDRVCNLLKSLKNTPISWTCVLNPIAIFYTHLWGVMKEYLKEKEMDKHKTYAWLFE